MYLSYIWRLAEMTADLNWICLCIWRSAEDLMIQAGFGCEAVLQAASWSGSSAPLFPHPPWTSVLTRAHSHGAAESEDNKPDCISKFQASACTTSAYTPLIKVMQMAILMVNMWGSILWESEHFWTICHIECFISTEKNQTRVWEVLGDRVRGLCFILLLSLLSNYPTSTSGWVRHWELARDPLKTPTFTCA